MRLRPKSKMQVGFRKKTNKKTMRRDKSEIDFQSNIDEFIRLAQRWNTFHKTLTKKRLS
jgi:hypothetical protein